MADLINYFILVPMVYIALAVFVLGLAFKAWVVFRSPRIAGTLAVFPKQKFAAAAVLADAFAIPTAYRKEKTLWFFLLLYHAVFTLLFLGHLELAGEIRWLQLIPHEIFLGAGAVGILLLVSVLYFLLRRFRTPFREISVPEDYIMLLLLFFTILFGSILHLAARYGGYRGLVEIMTQDYRTYLGGLLMLHPVLPDRIYFAPHFAVLVLHILFANLFLILFPFSKMVHSVFVFSALYLKRK
jgi:nitrate reductase gamma subunit